MIKVFVQQLGPKTSISVEQNLDSLTLAGPGTVLVHYGPLPWEINGKSVKLAI